MGMEVCCTLGMLNGEQAKQLKEAGLTAYNHNLDTSREFYPSVITTRQVVHIFSNERYRYLIHLKDLCYNLGVCNSSGCSALHSADLI